MWERYIVLLIAQSYFGTTVCIDFFELSGLYLCSLQLEGSVSLPKINLSIQGDDS